MNNTFPMTSGRRTWTECSDNVRMFIVDNCRVQVHMVDGKIYMMDTNISLRDIVKLNLDGFIQCRAGLLVARSTLLTARPCSVRKDRGGYLKTTFTKPHEWFRVAPDFWPGVKKACPSLVPGLRSGSPA